MLDESNFFAQEKVKAAIRFAELIRVVYGEKKVQEFLRSYCYLRNLDNLNDNNEKGAEEVKSELEDEINKMHDFKRGIRTSSFFGRLSDAYGRGIIDYFIANIEGFLVDNSIIRSRSPLSEAELRERNKKHYLSGFKITSLILFEREFEFGRKFERMGDTYIQYDALIDIREDFPNYLYLFPREELAKFCRYGVLDLLHFYEFTKRKILVAIPKNSAGIFETNAPLWFKVAFSAYFLSRYFKLASHAFDYKPEVRIGA
ncbi:hypothetical protein HYU50_04790 [Candidatus Woesearchaeota archaeon]|nr:hypothetical protein [Candidatus Woesearchaeota archaeon]